jgi:hypothetical protein
VIEELPVALENRTLRLAMSHSEQQPAFPLARRGLRILLGVVAFQIGYPILLTATFHGDPRITAAGIMFFVLGILMLLGFAIPRYLSAAASAAAGCMLAIASLSLLPMVLERSPEHWPIVLMFPVVPMIGLTICARLLLTNSAAQWQQLLWDQRLDAQFAERQQVLADRQAYTGTTQRCPWCDEDVVRPTDDRCRSCQRPV